MLLPNQKTCKQQQKTCCSAPWNKTTRHKNQVTATNVTTTPCLLHGGICRRGGNSLSLSRWHLFVLLPFFCSRHPSFDCRLFAYLANSDAPAFHDHTRSTVTFSTMIRYSLYNYLNSNSWTRNIVPFRVARQYQHTPTLLSLFFMTTSK